MARFRRSVERRKARALGRARAAADAGDIEAAEAVFVELADWLEARGRPGEAQAVLAEAASARHRARAAAPRD